MPIACNSVCLVLFSEAETQQKKSVQFNEAVEVKTLEKEPEEVEIDEEKIDRYGVCWLIYMF